MHEILKHLPANSRVLDLGCAAGSFPRNATSAEVVRLDLAGVKHRPDGALYVQADAASLPFKDHSFAAVISNHSLEHFEDLAGVLSELGRIICPGGALFVAVPDASTFTDKLYRWAAKGGGHVNAFTSPTQTAAAIERTTGLPHVATRLLCSSLSFLNRHNAPHPPRRLLLLGAGYEWTLFLYCLLSRRLDRKLRTRTSIYGWAFYFGSIPERMESQLWVNVCIRCGSGHSAASLAGQGLVGRGVFGLRVFRCPVCGVANPFAPDTTVTNSR